MMIVVRKMHKIFANREKTRLMKVGGHNIMN
jgi:hypothetical protein